MKSGAVNIMWLPSAKAKPRMFTCSTKAFYFFWTVVVGSWVALLGTGIFIYALHNNYAKIKQEHAVLTQKADQLDTVMKKVDELQKDEAIIRDFLGLQQKAAPENFSGQGGVPNVDLSSIAPEDSLSVDRSMLAAEVETMGDYELKASLVAANYHSIVQYMQEQRSGWELSPSILPIDADRYWLSSGFGWRTNPFTGQRDFHNGIDIAGRPMTPIVAPARGVVVAVGQDKYLGRFVQLDHTKGVVTFYGHLEGFNVKEGDRVERGAVIAFMGSTGLSTGTHLHYIVKVNGKAVNPRRYLLNITADSLLEEDEG